MKAMGFEACTSGLRMVNKRLMTALGEYYPYDYPEPETIAFCIISGTYLGIL